MEHQILLPGLTALFGWCASPGLARRICFGNHGELKQRYCQGLEDQLGALGPVLNAVVWWNNLHIDADVARPG